MLRCNKWRRKSLARIADTGQRSWIAYRSRSKQTGRERTYRHRAEQKTFLIPHKKLNVWILGDDGRVGAKWQTAFASTRGNDLPHSTYITEHIYSYICNIRVCAWKISRQAGQANDDAETPHMLNVKEILGSHAIHNGSYTNIVYVKRVELWICVGRLFSRVALYSEFLSLSPCVWVFVWYGVVCVQIGPNWMFFLSCILFRIPLRFVALFCRMRSTIPIHTECCVLCGEEQRFIAAQITTACHAYFLWKVHVIYTCNRRCHRFS